MPGLIILDREDFEDEEAYQAAVAKYIHPTTDEEKRTNNMITADDMSV